MTSARPVGELARRQIAALLALRPRLELQGKVWVRLLANEYPLTPTLVFSDNGLRSALFLQWGDVAIVGISWRNRP